MSTRTLSLDDAIYQYLLDVSLREHPVQAELRAANCTHRYRNMQIAPDQGQPHDRENPLALAMGRKRCDLPVLAGRIFA